jgi:hypothetical protein
LSSPTNLSLSVSNYELYMKWVSTVFGIAETNERIADSGVSWVGLGECASSGASLSMSKGKMLKPFSRRDKAT